MALSSTVVFTVTRQVPQLVVPVNPTPNEIKKVTDIDDQEGLRFQVPVVFFYKNSPSMKGKDPVALIREGLAGALVYYYPFAGRVMEGDNRKLLVNCNSKGLLFVEAHANVMLEQLGDSILPPCPFMEKFLIDVPGCGGIIGCPILLIQVTRFTCGGYALGIRFNHIIADGSGITQFLNAVTEFVKGASTPSIVPVWQREGYLNARSPPRITCTHYEFEQLPYNQSSTDIMESDPDKLIRIAIFFGPKELQALRNKALSENFDRCTRFELITACLWKCRTLALNPQDPDQMVLVSVLVNVRGKAGLLDLPTGYYGNAFAYPAAVSTAGTLCKSPLSYAVDLIRNAKAQMSDEYIKSVADLLVIKKRPKYRTNWMFIVSDITRLGFDKVDFGWGNPVYGGIPAPTPFISFYTNFNNSKGEEGVVVPICLPPLAVQKFHDELKKVISG